MTQKRRLFCVFLVCESAMVTCWWILFALFPGDLSGFFPKGFTPFYLLPGDILLFAIPALVCAYALRNDRKWGYHLLCVHSGAVCYAALLATAMAIIHPPLWIGALLVYTVTFALIWGCFAMRPPETETPKHAIKSNQ